MIFDLMPYLMISSFSSMKSRRTFRDVSFTIDIDTDTYGCNESIWPNWGATTIEHKTCVYPSFTDVEYFLCSSVPLVWSTYLAMKYFR